MKVMIKPGETVKFAGEYVRSTEDKPASIECNAKTGAALIASGIGAEVKTEAANSKSTK